MIFSAGPPGRPRGTTPRRRLVSVLVVLGPARGVLARGSPRRWSPRARPFWTRARPAPGAVEAVRASDAGRARRSRARAPPPRRRVLETRARAATRASFAGGTNTGHAADASSRPPDNASSTLSLPPESFTHVPPAKMDVLFDLFASQHFARNRSRRRARRRRDFEIHRRLPRRRRREVSRSPWRVRDVPSGPRVCGRALRGFDGLLAHDRDRREFYAGRRRRALRRRALSRFGRAQPAGMGAAGRSARRYPTYVERHWAKLRNDEALKDALGDAAFVETDDGGADAALARPSDVYDPEVAMTARARFAGDDEFSASRARRRSRVLTMPARAACARARSRGRSGRARRASRPAMRAGVAFPTPTNEGVERRDAPIPERAWEDRPVGEAENRRECADEAALLGLQRGTCRDENARDVF